MVHTHTLPGSGLLDDAVCVCANCRELQAKLSEADAQVKVTTLPSVVLLQLLPALLLCHWRVQHS